MATPLDLQEQEQLDQLKHFWRRYGNAITWVLIVVFGSFAAWNGWQYWQRQQAASAALLFDQLELAASDTDADRTERVWADLKDGYASTAFAHQGALRAAATLQSLGKTEAAKAALVWASEQSKNEGLQAVARLRLAALALEMQKPDEASQWLKTTMPAEFAGLAADRQGDVFWAQGKKDEARGSYEKAYAFLGERTEYRQLVEVKLNALGVDPKQATPAGTQAP